MLVNSNRCRKNPLPLVPLAAAAIIVCACIGIGMQEKAYVEAQKEYQQLRTLTGGKTSEDPLQECLEAGMNDGAGVSTAGPGESGRSYPAGDGGSRTGRRAETVEQGKAAEKGLPSVFREVPCRDVPDLQIDAAALAGINPDYAGVLFLPSLDLCYPVAAGRDNEEYLKKTFEGKENPAGCIFLDCGASRDLTDLHTFIFGHNMADGAMFGSLKRLSQEPGLLRENPYCYYYGNDMVLCYRLFACGPVDTGDDVVYAYLQNEAAYSAFLTHLARAAWYYDQSRESAAALEQIRPILTLSTCWGTAHTHNFTVHGVLVGMAEAERTE